jgi:hypothetical protein
VMMPDRSAGACRFRQCRLLRCRSGAAGVPAGSPHPGDVGPARPDPSMESERGDLSERHDEFIR